MFKTHKDETTASELDSSIRSDRLEMKKRSFHDMSFNNNNNHQAKEILGGLTYATEYQEM